MAKTDPVSSWGRLIGGRPPVKLQASRDLATDNGAGSKEGSGSGIQGLVWW